MDESARRQLESLELQLLSAPSRPVFACSTWAEDIPAVPGVYALWDNDTGNVVYVGETSSLRERMTDLGRTVNHTCRRKIIRLLELDGQDEATISREMSRRYVLSFLPVEFGRAELEDYLTLRWRETILNQPGARLDRGATYGWVKVATPTLGRGAMTDTERTIGDENVNFEFYALKKRPFVLTGRVEGIEGRMTLIVSLPGDDPYFIQGERKDDGTFEGVHAGSEEDYEVRASWALLGDRYVGTWYEADEFFIFSFQAG